MNIGQAALQSGVSAKMIRYYESTGLLPAARRGEQGYREYDDRDVHTLRFLQRSRSLGFSVDQMAALLALWQDRERASADVKRLALAHVSMLEAKIAALQEMAATLRHLAQNCRGNARPDCPILADLSQSGSGPGGAPAGVPAIGGPLPPARAGRRARDAR